MQLEFEFVFADKSYPGMTELELGPASDGYVRPKIWRSTDLGQTYRVTIVEDPIQELTVVTVTKPKADSITGEEGKQILDIFYPHRSAERQDNSGQGNSLKYAVWPTEADLELPWRKRQLMAKSTEH